MSNWQKRTTATVCSGKDLSLDVVHIGKCRSLAFFFGDEWISKLKRCKTWTEWLFLTKDFGHAWHSMLNLKYTSDLARGTDNFAIHEKRPRDDSNSWNVAWPSDSHLRLGRQQDCRQLDEWGLGGQGKRAHYTSA